MGGDAYGHAKPVTKGECKLQVIIGEMGVDEFHAPR